MGMKLLQSLGGAGRVALFAAAAVVVVIIVWEGGEEVWGPR